MSVNVYEEVWSWVESVEDVILNTTGYAASEGFEESNGGRIFITQFDIKYNKTSKERTLWDRGLCPLFGGCPLLRSCPFSYF